MAKKSSFGMRSVIRGHDNNPNPTAMDRKPAKKGRYKKAKKGSYKMKKGDFLEKPKEVKFGKAQGGRFGSVVGSGGSGGGDNWTQTRPPGFPAKKAGESNADYAKRTGAMYRGNPYVPAGRTQLAVMRMYYLKNYKSEAKADPNVGRKNTGLSEDQMKGRAAAEAYEQKQKKARADKAVSDGRAAAESYEARQKKKREMDKTRPEVGKDVGRPSNQGTAKPAPAKKEVSPRERKQNTGQGSAAKDQQGNIKSSGPSFSEAFAKARKEQGPGGTFMWNGKKYSTNRADDKKKTPAMSQPKAKKATAVPVNKPKQELAGVKKPKPAAKKPAARMTPSAGSGMGAVEREGSLKKELDGLKTSSGMVDRRKGKSRKENRADRKAVRKATRASIKATRKAGRAMRRGMR